MRSRFSKTCASALALTAVLGAPRRADAQACCAGSGLVTPGRLAPHEDALVGTELHGSVVMGSYDGTGHYAGQASGSGELDFEQDVFASIRFLRRAQAALLLPFVETWRREPGFGQPPQSAFGGGIGDANLSARYDFVVAGQSRYVPGIAALAGITAPTGRPPTATNAGTFAVDATGTGAWQGNFGLALEQAFGPWLVNATELFAWRAPFSAQGVDEALAPQWVTLAGVGYVLPNEMAFGLFGSYTIEGAPSINGVSYPDSGRRVTLISLTGIFPIFERLRLQASLLMNPPISGLGANQTATAGITFTVIGSWI